MSNTENIPKYIDLLDEDKPLAGQKFVCVSFVSPEKILKQKEMFFFQNFLKHYDFSKSMEKFQQFLNFISFKYNVNFDKVMEDYQDFVKSEKDKLTEGNIEDDYKNFIDEQEERLEKDFGEQHNFRTAVRGVKIRGSFPTQQEAELRCKMLREVDPNHDIYVGPVGMWMPWEPEAYKTGKVEYLEKELNQLMSEKQKNEHRAKQDFDTRVRETKERAIAENIKLAEDTGNKLTQNIDEQGNLVGVANMSTTETTLEKSNEVVSGADIRSELFEGDNIVTRSGNDNNDE